MQGDLPVTVLINLLSRLILPSDPDRVPSLSWGERRTRAGTDPDSFSPSQAIMALYNNGADVPSPQEASNGFPQPGASGTWHKGEEEVRLVEPSMVKKAHREILDHERKRRVELKCMELQEMMEEQG